MNDLCWPVQTVEDIWYSRPSKWISPKREYQKPLPGVVWAVAQATSSNFEREAISPKWENARVPLFPFSSSRLGKRSSLERENPLAWARPFSLSENWARMRQILFSSLFLYVCPMFGWITLLKYEMSGFCMYWMVYGLKLMSWVWSWHVKWLGWLVINIDMDLVCVMTFVGWRNTNLVWSGRNSTMVAMWCLI